VSPICRPEALPGATAQVVLVTVVMSPLTYVTAAANFPLQDANLLAIDRALGLDWAAYVHFVNGHPLLATWLSYGYTMIRWPIFAIPVVLAAALMGGGVVPGGRGETAGDGPGVVGGDPAWMTGRLPFEDEVNC